MNSWWREAVGTWSVVTCLLLGAGVAGCSAQSNAAEAKTAEPAAAAGETWRDEKMGYAWTLPADWEFLTPEELGFDSENLPLGMRAARKRGSEVPFAQIVVREMFLEPGEVRGHSDKALAELERDGRESLSKKGAQQLSSQRIDVFGSQGVEVTGLIGEQRYTSRSFYRDRRDFDLRCLAPADAGTWACESAYAAFEIFEAQLQPAKEEAPRVLHLRDAQTGLEFDAPSDAWLAVGPRTAQNGRQRVWTWSDGQRSVDVQTFDLSWLPQQPPASFIVEGLVKQEKTNGSTVSEKSADLSGLPSIHMVIDRSEGEAHDAFVLNHGKTNYVLRIRQKARDKKLIETLKRGFRLKRGDE